jgi:hypothetical protein
MIGAASIQALPLSACLAHQGRFSHMSPEEAISFGPLYERANVSCSIVLRDAALAGPIRTPTRLL